MQLLKYIVRVSVNFVNRKNVSSVMKIELRLRSEEKQDALYAGHSCLSADVVGP